MHFVFLLLISVIPILLLNFLSAMIPFLFVLKILLPPLQASCLASLYIDQFGPDEPADLHEMNKEPATAEVSTLPDEITVEQTEEVEENKPATEETSNFTGSDAEVQNPSAEKEAGNEEKK
jgi:hypothetical protein